MSNEMIMKDLIDEARKVMEHLKIATHNMNAIYAEAVAFRHQYKELECRLKELEVE